MHYVSAGGENEQYGKILSNKNPNTIKFELNYHL
jgi:hypothetical protein